MRSELDIRHGNAKTKRHELLPAVRETIEAKRWSEMRIEICDICHLEKRNVIWVRRKWNIWRIFPGYENNSNSLDFCESCFTELKAMVREKERERKRGSR